MKAIEKRVDNLFPQKSRRRRGIGLSKKTAIGITAVLIAATLIASAGLLSYFGTIETTVNVEQSIRLDGMTYSTGYDDITITNDISGGNLVAGSCVWSTICHTLHLHSGACDPVSTEVSSIVLPDDGGLITMIAADIKGAGATIPDYVAPVFADCDIIVDKSGGTGSYTTIQAAVTAASDNQVICVMSGTYNERVVINKPLTLLGEDKDTTIIDGTGMTTVDIPPYGNNGILIFPGSGYHMTDVDITISGFTVQNFAVIGAGGGAGIAADATYQYKNIIISDVIVQNNGMFGLYLPNVLNSHFSNIVADNNDQINDGTQGYGIHCSVHSSSNTFTNIVAKNHDHSGIMIMQANGNTFTNVECTDNYDGIYFYSSNDNIVENSILSDNMKGAKCYSGNGNEIHLSNIENNDVFGVESLVPFDATNNWWGCDGIIDVSDNVNADWHTWIDGNIITLQPNDYRYFMIQYCTEDNAVGTYTSTVTFLPHP